MLLRPRDEKTHGPMGPGMMGGSMALTMVLGRLVLVALLGALGALTIFLVRRSRPGGHVRA
jgi:hypothetical protein